jgi:LCP family protein required for cell wall assembly
MRKWLRVTSIVVSLAILATSGLAYFFSKTASTAIPRSKALKGAKQSSNGDTNILLLGLDSRRDNNGNNLPRKLLDYMHVGSSSQVGGYNTNTMIIIHIPASGKNAVAISIPRDDYVAVPGLGMKKIKEAYGLAKYYSELQLVKQGIKNPDLEHQSREAGRTATIATITQLLGIPIDHFAEVNLVGFYDLATALGGIQVCLNRAVNDSQYSGAVFPAGVQTITGVQALQFVRQRHGLPNGDLDRTHRQQAFITGVITKFRTQGLFGDIGKLQSLLNVAKKDVVIDDGFDVLGFLPQAKALTGGHITFHTLPILKYSMINGQSVNEIDPVAVKQFVQDLFYPKPKPSTSPSPSTSAAAGKTKIKKKIPLINQANGKPVDGSGIPCVN